MHRTAAGEEERAVFQKDDWANETSFRQDEFEDGVKTEIERRTEARVYRTKNISAKPILLDIYSPKYPDLQFVDLPGFTKTPVQGQAENIEDQILSLNMPFMQNENTIILAIQDATQNLSQSEALKHALSTGIDPEGSRTIGVITKLDKLTAKADKERVCNDLDNKTKPLSLGYFGVVNRSQEDIEANADMDPLRTAEERIKNSPEFAEVKHRIGIDKLRKSIINILAQKMKKLMPPLKDQSIKELAAIKSKLKTSNEDSEDEVNYDILMIRLVERSMEMIRKSIHGHDVQVNTREIETGATMNREIKAGAVAAAREAKETYSVEDFHKLLITGKANSHAFRDNVFPEALVLDIGVGLLTECYRNPFKALLHKITNYLKTNVSTKLDQTLEVYPKFRDLVKDIMLREIEECESKAEEYLDMQIDIHKRFVNSEHEEFRKVTELLKNNGIRFKNNRDIWFSENVNTVEEQATENCDRADEALGAVGGTVGGAVGKMVGGAVGGSVGGAVGGAITKKLGKTFLGLFKKLQQDNREEMHANKFPYEPENEAAMHIDLCIGKS